MFGNYLANMILNGWLRGVAVTLPTDVFLSLHTADPGATGASEAGTGAWPAYQRISSRQGDTMLNAWTEAGNPDHKIALNTKTMLFDGYDGAGTITLPYFGLWTAQTAGSFLFAGTFREDAEDPESAPAPKILGVTDELIIKPGKIGVLLV